MKHLNKTKHARKLWAWSQNGTKSIASFKITPFLEIKTGKIAKKTSQFLESFDSNDILIAKRINFYLLSILQLWTGQCPTWKLHQRCISNLFTLLFTINEFQNSPFILLPFHVSGWCVFWLCKIMQLRILGGKLSTKCLA